MFGIQKTKKNEYLHLTETKATPTMEQGQILIQNTLGFKCNCSLQYFFILYLACFFSNFG